MTRTPSLGIDGKTESSHKLTFIKTCINGFSYLFLDPCTSESCIVVPLRFLILLGFFFLMDNQYRQVYFNKVSVALLTV